MRYCAFLRAINVGKHNRIKMEELRSLLADAGLGNVKTYLQTGNVFFDGDGTDEELAMLIERVLEERGLRSAACVVRTIDEMQAIGALDPFSAEAPEKTRMVSLFRTTIPEEARESIAALPNVVLLRPKEMFTVVDGANTAAREFAAIERKYKLQATARYWHVVQEVARLLAEPS